MRRSPLPRQQTREAQAVADAVSSLPTRRGGSVPWTEGRLVRDVTVEATSEKEVAHGLGRSPQGWMVLSVRSDASNEYPVETERSAELLTIHNYGAADVTCDLWVW